MRLSIHHRTHYAYVGQSSASHNEIRLKPLTNEVQRCLEYKVRVSPRAKVYEYETIGGFVNHFSVMDAHEELDVLAESVVETIQRDVFESIDLISNDWVFEPDDEYRNRYAEFLTESPYIQQLPEVSAFVGDLVPKTAGNTAMFVLELKEKIFETFDYQANLTNVHSLLHELFDLKAGVCQDFSHLMIACCRSLGLAARYVSGYLYLGDHHELRGTQATHAWVEVLLPSGLWLGVDPTNNILVDDRYVKVHVGRDYSDVTPIKGVYMGFGTAQMDVGVDVQALSSA
ncbi:MAG: transglutaminase family protein [Armatimonadetes bacterium]|nr:transglutaminase family protein [Armatimonadota bacterium]